MFVNIYLAEKAMERC